MDDSLSVLQPVASDASASTSSLYEMLKHAHSGWRWLVLLFVTAAIVNAFLKWQRTNAKDASQEGWSPADKQLSLFALIASHLQLVFGLALYFTSPTVELGLASMGGAMKEAQLRYFAIEHPMLMLLGLVFITVGYSKGKRSLDSREALKQVWLWYGIGLILILSRVPFPGMMGTSWS